MRITRAVFNANVLQVLNLILRVPAVLIHDKKDATNDSEEVVVMSPVLWIFFVENVAVPEAVHGGVYVHLVHQLVPLNLKSCAHRVLVEGKVELISMNVILCPGYAS